MTQIAFTSDCRKSAYNLLSSAGHQLSICFQLYKLNERMLLYFQKFGVRILVRFLNRRALWMLIVKTAKVEFLMETCLVDEMVVFEVK
ncbi:hypothetical protein L3X38_016508 [Prunus dulcis]|uniref:Uncharacterized protein n=1 Tax=Prunus dulcis TaxID=3755 RepID=A0AAD4Z984_PRUDU|nr:hypothetical protein L3X38_016508 [Prunus dulcis]